MVRKKKEFRALKVSSFGGYGCKTAPMIRLQGLWLEQCGFNIWDPILVKCEDGKLTITLDETSWQFQRRLDCHSGLPHPDGAH